MTNKEIPGWAWEEANRRLNEAAPASINKNLSEGRMFWPCSMPLLAAMIAEYEQPPVDPFLLKARQIAADVYREDNYPEKWIENHITNGRGIVEAAAVRAALTALQSKD
jgi:hypothetical protein